ncbi:hypothetical protein LTR17_005911 [Elasticomyces elasticus]|nr:hypothetical protein LTR17_005911 [Elasticomyces elasticus]
MATNAFQQPTYSRSTFRAEAGYYTAYLAYHDVTDGGERQLMVGALQSLLDVLALGLFESGEKFTAEENVKWVEYGDGEMTDANATILFPNQISHHQEGDKNISATEAFTVVVTKAPDTYPAGIFTGFYRAYCLADSDFLSLECVAKGGLKSTVVEALRSLLDTLAVALSAKLEEKVRSEENWVKRGDGKVMGMYA